MTVFSGTSILTCSQVARDSRSRIKTAVILGNQYQRLQLSSEAIAISTCCQTSYTHTSNYFIRWHTTHDFVLYILCVAARFIIQEAYSKSHPKRGYKINEPRNLSLRRSWAHEHLHKLGNMFLGNHFSQERSIQVWLSHLHWQEIAKMIYRQMWLRRREKLAERKFHAKLLQQLLLPPLE